MTYFSLETNFAPFAGWWQTCSWPFLPTCLVCHCSCWWFYIIMLPSTTPRSRNDVRQYLRRSECHFSWTFLHAFLNQGPLLQPSRKNLTKVLINMTAGPRHVSQHFGQVLVNSLFLNCQQGDLKLPIWNVPYVSQWLSFIVHYNCELTWYSSQQVRWDTHHLGNNSPLFPPSSHFKRWNSLYNCTVHVFFYY